MTVLNSLKSFFSFNDNVFSIYLIIMGFFIVVPNLFFVNHTAFISSWVLFYLVFGFIIKPKRKRIDLSKNLLIYIGLGIVSWLLFSILVQPIAVNETVVFTSTLSKFLYVIFVIGFSESIIRQGIFERLQNKFYTYLIMAGLHLGSYASLLNASIFSFEVISYLIIPFFAFGLFHLIYNRTDLMGEAVVHGMYDYTFY